MEWNHRALGKNVKMVSFQSYPGSVWTGQVFFFFSYQVSSLYFQYIIWKISCFYYKFSTIFATGILILMN